MFDIIELPLEEQIKAQATHRAAIDFNKLAETADTTVTLTISDYIARDIAGDAWLDLVVPFDGGATSALKLDFGFNGASVDDADAFLDNVEIHLDATEILANVGPAPTVGSETVNETYGTEESTVITELVTATAALRNKRVAFQEAGSLEMVFTATGANLSTLTAGRVHVYFTHIQPTKIRGSVNY